MMGKGLFVLLALFSILSPRFCSHIEHKIAGSAGAAEDCPLFPCLRGIFDFKLIRYAEELLKCTLWLFQFIVNIFYSIINTVVATFIEIASNIFSGVRLIIKVVEFVGYCVRVVLHVNYNFVYSVLTSLHILLEKFVEVLRNLVQTLVSVIIALFWSIIKLLHNIVMVIPQAFQFGYSGVRATKEATSSLLYNSYQGWKYILTVPGSTLMTVFTTTRAVLECFFVTLLNTILLIIELAVNSTVRTFQYMIELAATLSSSIVSAWDSVVHCARLVDDGIRHFVSMTVYLILSVIEALIKSFVSLIQAIFKQTCGIFHAAGSIVVNTALFCWNSTCSFFSSLVALFQRSIQGLQILLRMSSHYTPGGGRSITSILSASLLMLCSYLVFGFNPVGYVFGAAEKLLQSLITFLSSRPLVKEEAPVREQRWMDTGSDKEEDTSNLRAELNRERDKHLCVVCQDKPKNMIVMPCRHMCLCLRCSRELLHLRQWQSRTCPLCRGRITSVLEVYT